MRIPAALILLSSFLLSSRAWGGPPFVTDDPEPVELHHWEFYLASNYNHTSDTDSATLPEVEVNYGALPELQLHMVAPAVYDSEAGSGTHYGLGDFELGAKYRFIQETGKRPQVGVFPLIELPTGDEHRGLGNGRVQVFLPLWLQKSFGPWTTYGGGGWWYNPGQDHRDFWRIGWEVQRDLTLQRKACSTVGW